MEFAVNKYQVTGSGVWYNPFSWGKDPIDPNAPSTGVFDSARKGVILTEQEAMETIKAGADSAQSSIKTAGMVVNGLMIGGGALLLYMLYKRARKGSKK